MTYFNAFGITGYDTIRDAILTKLDRPVQILSDQFNSCAVNEIVGVL